MGLNLGNSMDGTILDFSADQDVTDKAEEPLDSGIKRVLTR